jgi:superfamily II DNA or RNA helicase
MIGRGLRTSPGKTHCTVVDMTDTIKKVGRIETFKVEKVDGKWEIVTEKGSFHGKELYRFAIEK